jgi:hypothetical protein
MGAVRPLFDVDLGLEDAVGKPEIGTQASVAKLVMPGLNASAA